MAEGKKDEVTTKKKCFIITPIGGSDDPIRRHIDGIIQAAIKPALEQKFEIIVAHEMENSGSITKQVIEEIYNSELVIANLTNRNPNVMYELAFRHSLGKPVIQIMEKGTTLPFDIVTERTIDYVNDAKGVLELRAALERFAEKVDFEDCQQGPVYDALKSIQVENRIVNDVESAGSIEIKSDAFGYLVDRLDKIEGIVSSKSLLSDSANKRRPYVYLFTFFENVTKHQRVSIEAQINIMFDTSAIIEQIKNNQLKVIIHLPNMKEEDAYGIIRNIFEVADVGKAIKHIERLANHEIIMY